MFVFWYGNFWCGCREVEDIGRGKGMGVRGCLYIERKERVFFVTVVGFVYWKGVVSYFSEGCFRFFRVYFVFCCWF